MQIFGFQTFKLIFEFFMSELTVETYCFADGRCLIKQPQSVTSLESVWRGDFKKKCKSVRPFVTLTKKSTSPLLTAEK